MSQKAAPEIRGNAAGERSSFLPAALSCNFDSPLAFDSLLAENQAVSETVDPNAALLFGTSARSPRSEPRSHLSAPLWLTSLHKPGVFEVVPTENVSRAGIRMVTRTSWEPAERVLVSSPPGFCLQGSVVYCKKLPSEDYVLGIRLNAPVEDWIETLGLMAS
jgi:hypothetical protein